MARPNYYILLGLDEAERNPARIEEAIRQKRTDWSRETTHPTKGPQARQHLDLIPEIQTVMGDAQSREAEARDAARLRQQTKQHAIRELDQALAVVVADRGFLWKEQLATLVKEFDGRLSEADIRRQVRVPIQDKATPSADPLLEPSQGKRIQDRLKLLGKRDLYDFLERRASSSLSDLRSRGQDIYRAALNNDRKDADLTARQELAGEALELFKSEAGREKYNNTLSRQRLAQLDALIQAAAAGGRIEVGVTKELLRVARDKGLAEDETLDYLRAKAAEKKVSIEIPSAEGGSRRPAAEERKAEGAPVPQPLPAPPGVTQYRRLAVVLATGAAAAVLVGYGFHHAAFSVADRGPTTSMPELQVPGSLGGLETSQSADGTSPVSLSVAPPAPAETVNQQSFAEDAKPRTPGGTEGTIGLVPPRPDSEPGERGKPPSDPRPPLPPEQPGPPTLTQTKWVGDYRGDTGTASFVVAVDRDDAGELRGTFEWPDVGLSVCFHGLVSQDRRQIAFRDLQKLSGTSQVPPIEFSAVFPDREMMRGQANNGAAHSFQVSLVHPAKIPKPSKPVANSPQPKKQRSPSSTGSVLAVSGDVVTVDLGQRDGVKVGKLLIVTLGHNKAEVNAFVEEAEENTCRVKLWTLQSGIPRVGDSVKTMDSTIRRR